MRMGPCNQKGVSHRHPLRGAFPHLGRQMPVEIQTQAEVATEVTSGTIKPTKDVKVGNHRGNLRVWLEDSANDYWVSEAGFTPGTRYDVIHNGTTLYLFVTPKGKRKVSRKGDRAIIDINNKSASKALAGYKRADIRIREGAGSILISPKPGSGPYDFRT